MTEYIDNTLGETPYFVPFFEYVPTTIVLNVGIVLIEDEPFDPPQPDFKSKRA